MKTHVAAGVTGIVGVVVLLCLYDTGSSFLRKYRRRDDARQQLSHFMARIKAGDSQARVSTLFNQGQYQALTFKGAPGATQWLVDTPLEFPPDNWLLILKFNAKSRLSAAHLGTTDSPNVRPVEPAPADF